MLALHLLLFVFDLYKDVSILIITAIIVIIIIFIVLWISTKQSSHDYYKRKFHINTYPPEIVNLDKQEDINLLKDENRRLKEIYHKLNQENTELRKELDDLNNQMESYGYKTNFKVLNNVRSNPELKGIENIYSLDAKPQNNDQEQKILVSFSFEEKNGTVKADPLGDMYLTKNGYYYDLFYEKEIYGTAIHLEQIQYSFKILNPKEANNRPMAVLKAPKYSFNTNEGKGYLQEKGEVKYQ